jgi:hypothetical protein
MTTIFYHLLCLLRLSKYKLSDELKALILEVKTFLGPFLYNV